MQSLCMTPVSALLFRSPESVHIIVDKSAPRGDYFAAAFEDQQPDHVLLKRKLLMHVFYAVLGYSTQKELTELEADLEVRGKVSNSTPCMCLLKTGTGHRGHVPPFPPPGLIPRVPEITCAVPLTSTQWAESLV